jgi:amino acid transporter/nucleotide-binding universal stress UspA family protein
MSEGPEHVNDAKIKLRRDLGLKEITMIGLGPTIGSTIFLLVGGGIGIAGPALILVFVLNFLVTLLTAMAYAELGSAFSDTGGGYIWVKDGMPQPFGFLAGWLSWFGHAIVTSFYVVGFGFGVIWLMQAYGATMDGVTPEAIIKTLAVLACIVFIWINYRGTKSTGRSSLYITATLIAIVVIYIVAGLVFMFGKPDLGASFQPFLLSEDSGGGYGGLTSIFIAMGFTFIVFEGYEIIAQCGEECKDAEKNIPRASVLAISISAIIFILVAVVTIGVSGWQAAAHFGENAVAEIANISMPRWGLQLIGIGVIIGSLAAVNSTLYSSSRVAYAMGRDGAIPRGLGNLHPTRQTPHVAILVSGAIVICLTVFLPIRQIVVAADIMFLMLMIFVNMAVITLRIKHPDVRRRYVMPLFPIIPIIGLLANGIMAYSLWTYEPIAWYMALFWILIGLLAYLLYTDKSKITRKAETPPDVEVSERHEGHYCVMAAVAGPQDTSIVELAALVSRIEGGDLHLLHVIEVPETESLESVSYARVSKELKLLSKAKKLAGDMRAHVHTKIVVSHKPSEAIIEEARELGASVIFLGWRGKHGTEMLMGSNIDRVVQNSPCDVVIYKSKEMPEEVNNILVVATGEGNDTYAAGMGVLLAKRYKATITLLAAPSHARGARDMAGITARLDQIFKTHGIPCREASAKTKNMDAAIMEAANEQDIVIIGAVDEERFTQFVFGSVQNRLAEKLDKPYIIVQKVKASKEPSQEAPESASRLLHEAFGSQ